MGKKPKEGKGEKVRDWKTLKLWKQQKTAVQMIEKYIRAKKKEEKPKAALLQIPSGAGKTGVIAVSSICLPEAKVVLILVPRADLITPVINEIQKEFWDNIGIKESPLKDVKRFQPPKVQKCIHRILDASAVLVSTPNSVMSVTNSNQEEDLELFDKLKARVALVIIDGRHCNSLKNWRKAVDELAKPTVLLKETLYRDDFRSFDIDRSYLYFYSYEKALEDEHFPPLKFDTGEKDYDMETFAREVVHRLENRDAPDSRPAERVLIHCETYEDVKKMTKILRDITAGVIGIHDHANEEDQWEHIYNHISQKVLAKEAIYWVLPLRLMRQFDFKGVCVLAVYNSFDHDLVFVEQLGRFLRNCKCESRSPAYVFSNKSSGCKEVWERYLQYQQEFTAKVQAIPPADKKNGTDILLKRHLIADPLPIDFIDGRFSKEFDIFDPDALDCLNLPHAVYINKVGAEGLSQSLDDVVGEIVAEWTDRERVCHSPAMTSHPETPESRVILYYAYRNSPLLKQPCYFWDRKLGVTILHWERPYLFYYDSEGAVPEVISALEQKLTSVDLRKLLDKGAKSQRPQTPLLTQVGLKNSNLGQMSIRDSSQRAFSLRQTIHGPADHSFICKQAIGHIFLEENQDQNS
jgi:hypothetical protein